MLGNIVAYALTHLYYVSYFSTILSWMKTMNVRTECPSTSAQLNMLHSHYMLHSYNMLHSHYMIPSHNMLHSHYIMIPCRYVIDSHYMIPSHYILHSRYMIHSHNMLHSQYMIQNKICYILIMC